MIDTVRMLLSYYNKNKNINFKKTFKSILESKKWIQF